MELFKRGMIGKLSLKNRIVMSAMNTGLILPFDEGGLSPRGIDFYTARARGGVGLIVTSFMRLNRKLEPSSNEPVVNSWRCVSWLNDLAEAVHDYGAKVCVQLSPGLGRIPSPNPNLSHGGLVAPSPLPSIRSRDGKMPKIVPGRYPVQPENTVETRELTIEEIEELVRDFEFSARIVKTAEIDAIEIHGHQGYLLDEFMTSLWNKRTDKYGGDLEGRLTLAYEIIEAVKRGAGTDFPIIFRYPITHYLEGARDIEEGLEIARRLEAAGVAALSINGGCYETYNQTQPPTTQPRGCWVELAEMTKKVVDIPVIVSGKLGYPELAESVLQEGKADFISLGRYLLADAGWPNKVKEGRTDDIRPCLGCHEGCIARVRLGKHISCAVNPTVGLEREYVISTAEKKKNVLVIGGGPGGMEAARVAALRGHHVTLMEKNSDLGGNLIPASVPGFKGDYRLLIDYLSTQVKKLGVKIELNTEATKERVLGMKPDVAFLATGARPLVPDIEGIEKGLETGKVMTAVDSLLSEEKADDPIVIIGGGLVGCETALYLAREQGRSVTIVEVLDSVALDMVWANALDLVRLLDLAEVKIMTNIRVREITDTGLIVIDGQNKEIDMEAGTIILAAGMKPHRELVEALADMELPEVYTIGDCVEPSKVLCAVWQGFRTARLV